MDLRRIIITGLGAISPLGVLIESPWKNLLEGGSSDRHITHFNASELPNQIAGENEDFNPTDCMDIRGSRRLARFAQIALPASTWAIEDAGPQETTPEPDTAGKVRALHWALKIAKLNPEEINYINAHGSCAQHNNFTATRAKKSIFGSHISDMSMNSTKFTLGLATDASGALEANVCALRIQHSWIRPTINNETPDPDCDLDHVPNQARQVDVNAAILNLYGLGGQYACLVKKRFSD